MSKMILGIDEFGGGPEGIHGKPQKPDAEQGFGNNAKKPCSAPRFDPPRNQWIP